jgi:ribose transport system substrate-binding protein
MLKKILLAGAALALVTGGVQAKELKTIGVSLGSLGNPFFIALSKGAEFEAKKTNPNVKLLTFGFDYDLGKQVNQIDNFIAAGVDLILLNPGDVKALRPAIEKAQKAGIKVVAVDTNAEGADAAVTTDNVQAGEIACQYFIDKLNKKGNVIIENGPQVSSVVDRVTGCKKALAAAPDMKLLSSDQDGKGSRDGGLTVMKSLLTRFPKVDAIFAINDPQALGSNLAAKQLNRTGMIITSVDGAPDIEAGLKDPGSPMIQASASQDPFGMARKAVDIGVDLLNGKEPAQKVTLIPSTLVTRDNVNEYKGWTSDRSGS